VTGYEGITFNDHERAVNACVNLALDLGLPLWIGEFGVGSSAYKARKWVEDVLYLFDRYALGYAWWSYWRDDRGMGLLYRDGKEKGELIQVLDRPYPRRNSMRQIHIYFEMEKGTFHVRYHAGRDKDLVTHIYIPRRHFTGFPDQYEIWVSDGSLYYEL